MHCTIIFRLSRINIKHQDKTCRRKKSHYWIDFRAIELILLIIPRFGLQQLKWQTISCFDYLDRSLSFTYNFSAFLSRFLLSPTTLKCCTELTNDLKNSPEITSWILQLKQVCFPLARHVNVAINWFFVRSFFGAPNGILHRVVVAMWAFEIEFHSPVVSINVFVRTSIKTNDFVEHRSSEV